MIIDPAYEGYYMLGIVGTSHLSECEERDARQRIVFEIRRIAIEQYPKAIAIVTGDADGIDKLAKETSEEQGYIAKCYVSNMKQWDGESGFKMRNLAIADCCNELICITTRLKNTPCYHCKTSTHERTGGCWTMNKAKEFGKNTELIVI